MMGPRTSSFCNALSFRKIRKYRVRGPSHIGLPPGNPKEICALMMPLKAYTKGRPRISRHLHRDMHPDDATGSVYHGSPAHISRHGELLFYAQRRGFIDVSAHRVHIRGCSFGRPSPPDPSLTLRMTGRTFCTRSFAGAQDDREDVLYQILR